MNYYEKIIQEKKNYKIFGMDGDQYESRYISEYARKFAEEAKKIAKHNSKEEKGYYQSIIEKKNANPEESMRKLQALKPIVEAFKRKGMTKHEVAMRLMQERDITETLAQQCVDTWY